jgi:hypothetical protein
MNQQQQIAQGSLKSSHRNTHAVVLHKPNEKQIQEAINLLNNYCHDLVISQRLNPDKNQYAEIPLKKAPFFVYTNKTKSEPGFLVFLPKSNPIFVRYNLSKKERLNTNGSPLCYTLRMRVSPEVYEGSIFVATLDVISHTLLLEDIYVWRKENIFETKKFIERRVFMEEFVQRHWIPDVRLLSGIITEIIHPQPLSSLKELIGQKDFTKVFLIPNTPNKRRFTFNLNDSFAKIEGGYYGRKIQTNQMNQKNQTNQMKQSNEIKIETPIKKDIPINKHTYAKAIRIPEIPDVYELFDTNDNSLSRACVQQLDLSKLLKTINSDSIMVKITYNNDFNRYEIIGLYTP